MCTYVQSLRKKKVAHDFWELVHPRCSQALTSVLGEGHGVLLQHINNLTGHQHQARLPCDHDKVDKNKPLNSHGWTQTTIRVLFKPHTIVTNSPHFQLTSVITATFPITVLALLLSSHSLKMLHHRTAPASLRYQRQVLLS